MRMGLHNGKILWCLRGWCKGFRAFLEDDWRSAYHSKPWWGGPEIQGRDGGCHPMNRDVRKDVQKNENVIVDHLFFHSLYSLNFAVWSSWQFADTFTLHRSSKRQRILCVCSSFVFCSVCVFDYSKRNIYPLVLRVPSDFTVRGTYYERIPGERRTIAVTLLFLWIFVFLETDGNTEYSEKLNGNFICTWLLYECILSWRSYCLDMLELCHICQTKSTIRLRVLTKFLSIISMCSLSWTKVVTLQWSIQLF